MATPRSAPPDSAHIALQLRLRQVELSGQILSNACSVHWRVASNPGAWLSSVNAPISDALTVVPESPLLGSYYVGNVPTCFWRAGMGFYGLPPFPKERGARSRGLPGSPMGAPALEKLYTISSQSGIEEASAVGALQPCNHRRLRRTLRRRQIPCHRVLGAHVVDHNLKQHGFLAAVELKRLVQALVLLLVLPCRRNRRRGCTCSSSSRLSSTPGSLSPPASSPPSPA